MYLVLDELAQQRHHNAVDDVEERCCEVKVAAHLDEEEVFAC